MGTVYNTVQSGSTPLFSPFTPSTFMELNKEIAVITSNLQSIQETCYSPEQKHALLENLIDQSRYLLQQKHNHLEAIHRLAADTPILQKDYEELIANQRSLVKDVNILSQKLRGISLRSIANN